MLNAYLYFWLLPALITLLLVIKSYKRDEGPMESWNERDWGIVLFFSVLYPLGLFGFFILEIWPHLIKER